jgi:hypothetical protein
MTPQETIDGFNNALAAAKEYADLIIKPPLEQLGGILADAVGFWRLRNKVRLLLKTKQYLEEQQVEPTKLLPNVFVPLVEEAGNTDDETLSEMFARLLASHLETAQAGKVHPSFAKTLGQLSGLDAQILRMVDRKDEHNWQNRKNRDQHGEWTHAALISETRRRWSVSADQADLSIANLERLGLCKVVRLKEPDFAGVRTRDYQVTKFGQRLLGACSKPGSYWRHAYEGAGERLWEKFDEVRSTPRPATCGSSGSSAVKTAAHTEPSSADNSL